MNLAVSRSCREYKRYNSKTRIPQNPGFYLMTVILLLKTVTAN